MNATYRRDELALFPDAARGEEPQRATWNQPRLLKLRATMGPNEEATTASNDHRRASTSGDAEHRSPSAAVTPRSSTPITIDNDRAEAIPVRAHYAEVIEDCLERLAMLARHRNERPLRGRREIEARMLAQVDAIVEAGVTVADLVAYCDREVDDDPWAAWAATFTLGCIEGREPIMAVRDICEALPDDALQAPLLVAEALVAAPHRGRDALGRELVRSSSPLARAVGIELLSRIGRLAPEIELAALDDEHPEVRVSAIRAVVRREPVGAVLARLRASLRSEHACVVCEAARALALFGQDDALEEIRGGGRLAEVLGEAAIELFVLRGELDDIHVLQRLVKQLPASNEVLSAIGRFGHPTAWTYLLQGLARAELADAAHDALVTLFGALAAEESESDPAAWRTALETAEVPQGVRLRRGAPWSERGVLAECASGALSRREIELRLDEVRARTGTRIPVDLAEWGAAMVEQVGGAPLAHPKGAPSHPALPPQRAVQGAPEAPRMDRAPAALPGTSTPIIAPNVVVLQPAATRQSDDVSPFASDVRGTFQGVLHRGEAFPFNPNAPSSLPPSTGAERFARVGSDVGATIDAPTAPAGPALPFPAAAELKGPAGFSLQQYAALCVELTAAPGDVEVNEVLRRYQITAEQRKALDEHWQGRIGSDLRVLAVFDRAHKEAAARFAVSRGPSPRTSAGPTGSAPAPSASPPTNAPPVQRAPAALSATSIGVITPKKAALPFKPQGTATGSPSEPSSPAPTPASMPPVKRAPVALSGTVMGTMVPKGAVLPFSPEAAAPSHPAPTSAEPPPLPAPSAEPPPGGLSLQQFASLCVELEVVPNEADEILRRYRITAEQRTVIDTDWQGRIAADPRVRTVFDQAYAAYKAWFVASRRR